MYTWYLVYFVNYYASCYVTVVNFVSLEYDMYG